MMTDKYEFLSIFYICKLAFNLLKRSKLFDIKLLSDERLYFVLLYCLLQMEMMLILPIKEFILVSLFVG